jgi:hypothetical protein
MNVDMIAHIDECFEKFNKVFKFDNLWVLQHTSEDVECARQFLSDYRILIELSANLRSEIIGSYLEHYTNDNELYNKSYMLAVYGFCYVGMVNMMKFRVPQK